MDFSKIKSVKEADVKGKKIFLRVDLNTPVSSGKVSDDFRIKKVLPTISFLKEKGAKIVLASHFESKESDSLKPAYDYLKNIFELSFVEDFFSSESKDILNGLREGEIVLLENLRKSFGEKDNDQKFAKNLASMCDIYVNEAFSASHRNHASIVSVPKFIPGYAGFLFMQEIENLSAVFKAPKPFLFVLGGAKFDTKILLLKKFLKLADFVFIGGVLANDVLKYRGYEIGKSAYSGDGVDLSFTQDGKVYLPSDVLVKNNEQVFIKKISDIEKDDVIVDCGKEGLNLLKDLSEKSKFILWNGPLGFYEDGFKDGTFKLAQIISDTSKDSVVGGGDTVASIATLNLEEKFKFISTGGGAMLDFLANETLPGIKALVGN